MIQLLEEKSLKTLLNCNKKVTRIALISDTHIGGKIESFKRYNKAYDIIDRYNVDGIFHLGDFFERRLNPHSDNFNPILEQAISQKIIEKAIMYYPTLPSINTFIVRGNYDTMYDASLKSFCMIEQLCKYCEDLINITSQTKIDPKYLNVHSDIYFWDNIKILFRHGYYEDISYASKKSDIFIAITGHYHEYLFSDNNNFYAQRPLVNHYRLHVPALAISPFKEEVDLVIIEINEEYVEISPISLENNGTCLIKKRIKR